MDDLEDAIVLLLAEVEAPEKAQAVVLPLHAGHVIAHLATHLSAHMATHLSAHMATHLSAHMATHLATHGAAHLTAHATAHRAAASLRAPRIAVGLMGGMPGRGAGAGRTGRTSGLREGNGRDDRQREDPDDSAACEATGEGGCDR
jgi:hypothetical protein